MANPIKNTDLLDENAVNLIIAQFEAMQKGYERSVEGIMKKAKELEAALKDVNAGTRKGKEDIEKHARAGDELERAYNKLSAAMKQNAVHIQEVKAATRKQVALNKAQAALAKEVKGSYNALSAQYTINKIKLNSLSAEYRDNTAEGKRLVKQTNNIYKEMIRLQNQTGKNQLKVGDYDSSVKKLAASLKRLAFVYLGFDRAGELISSIFQGTKTLDGYREASEAVMKSEARRAEVTRNINNLTDDLGLNLDITRKSFIKFQAAANSTKLVTSQTDQIFRSFAKASSVLSLSSDEMRGVFLALEQMISKGKISSEELRGQLGERMPGAFNIFAKSMGVSVSQLSDMLKKGEVLSEETLPAFAREIEKAYGIEQVKRVNTLTAAQNRLSREWTLFIEFLDSSDTFKNLYETAASGVRFIRENFTAIANLTKGVTVATIAYGTWKAGLLAANIAQRAGIAATLADAASKGLLVTATKLATISTRALNTAIRANPYVFAATAIITLLSSIALFRNEVTESKRAIQEVETTAQKNIVRERLRSEQLVKILKDENKNREQKAKALEELKRISPQYFGNLDEEKSKVDDINIALRDYKNNLLKVAKAQAAQEKLIELNKQLIDNEQLWKDSSNGALGYMKAVVKSGGNSALVGANLAKQQAQNFAQRKKDIEEQIEAIAKLAVAEEEIVKKQTVTKEEPTDLTKLKISQLEKLAEAGDKAAKKELARRKKIIKLDRERKESIDELLRTVQDADAKVAGPAAVARLEYERTIATIKEMKAEAESLGQTFDFTSLEIIAKSELTRDLDEILGDPALIKNSTDLLGENLKNELTKLGQQDFVQPLGQSGLSKDIEKGVSDEYIKGIQAAAAKIKAESNTFKDDVAEEGIFSAIAFDLRIGSKAQEDIKTFYNFALSEAINFAKHRQQIAQQNIEAAQAEISEAETALQREIDARNAGYAHRVGTAAKELADAKKREKEQIKAAKKAQKDQIALETLQQSSSLITAAAKIWAQVGFPAAIPAVSTMFGSFALAKIRAFQLAKNKKEFAEGGYTVLAGGRHSSGNDTNLGFAVDGQQAYGEQGEGVAVFNRANTAKYRGIIPKVVRRINDGTFENHFKSTVQAASEIPMFAPAINMNNQGVIDELKAMRTEAKGKEQWFTDKDGSLVRIRGNIRTKYR